MNKIEVRPTCIQVNDYKWGDAPNLEGHFKIWDSLTKTFFYKRLEYDEENHKLYLPRGMDVGFVEKCIGDKAKSNHTYSEYITNSTPTLLKYGPKDEVQQKTLQFLTGTGEYSYTKNFSQLLVALNTGAGKTYLGIAYMAYLNAKSIIITSSVSWLEQWKERIVEHSNIKANQIFNISGAWAITKLMNQNAATNDKYKIYLVSHSTLCSLAERQGWDSVGLLFRHLGIGIKIFDEAHLYFESMTYIDYHSDIYKTVYMTATPERGETNDNYIFQLYFKNVPTISFFDPEKDPRTHYIAIKYNSGISPRDSSRCFNLYGFNKGVYSRLVTKYENFYKACRIVFDLIKCMKGRILIFMASNESIQILYDWILANYPEYNGSVGIFTSLNCDKKRAINNKIILTTSISAGEAMDIPDLFCSVQLAEPMKSRPKVRQRLGRTRIRGSYFIDVIDDSVNKIRQYFEENLCIYEEYALTVKILGMSNRQLDKLNTKIVEERKKGISPFTVWYEH